MVNLAILGLTLWVAAARTIPSTGAFVITLGLDTSVPIWEGGGGIGAPLPLRFLVHILVEPPSSSWVFFAGVPFETKSGVQAWFLVIL